ncbi:hypothetical protein E2C01_090208 [Portunus trituberculatus]|uniref:Uncharacterized protein n=1 Tax=Portunus trituberculatus TaxID=210409 RepID=A0A5B7JL81_PORTR|nr:hypothetical protein [Portunus trituberculatus]
MVVSSSSTHARTFLGQQPAAPSNALSSLQNHASRPHKNTSMKATASKRTRRLCYRPQNLYCSLPPSVASTTTTTTTTTTTITLTVVTTSE